MPRKKAAERATRVVERRTATRAEAAEELGISTRTLAAKMTEYGIEE